MFKEYLSYCCSCKKYNKSSISLDCKHQLCINCIAILLIKNQTQEILIDEIQVQCKQCNYITPLSIPLAYKLTRSLNLKNLTNQSQSVKLNLFCMECLEHPFTIEQYLSGEHKNHKIKTVQQASPFLNNILTYAAKDLQKQIDNLYRQQEKLKHCINLINDVVSANIMRIKLGFQQLRNQINKREQEIEFAYRIAVQRQFRTAQIDLEELHKIIEQSKSQLEWIVQNVLQDQIKKDNSQQKIKLVHYFADNYSSFSIPSEFLQSLKQKIPTYRQIVRLNRQIVYMNQTKIIVDSIRHLKCFEEQQFDQNSTEASQTLTSSYFQEKKKQVLGQHKNTYPPVLSKLEMVDNKEQSTKKTKIKQQMSQDKTFFFNRRLY